MASRRKTCRVVLTSRALDAMLTLSASWCCHQHHRDSDTKDTSAIKVAMEGSEKPWLRTRGADVIGAHRFMSIVLYSVHAHNAVILCHPEEFEG